MQKLLSVRVAAGTNEMVSRRVAKVAAFLVSELREKTPVDTGWAANNWIPAKESQAPTKPLGSRKNVAAAAAAADAGMAVIATYNAATDGRLVVVNNVPYINRLNNGHSKKAPKNFIDMAVSRAGRLK